MSLHENEYTIHDDLVGRLVGEQTPQWAGLPLVRLETSGTVNVAYRLGDDKLIRLPRTEAYRGGPQREARWLPKFASAVPLETPDYLALGRPTDEYPCYWSVLRWIEGTNADRGTLDDLRAAASALGEFILALRSVSTEGAPEGGNYRGFGLTRVHDSFQRWLGQMPEDDVGRHRMLKIWEQCVSVAEWSGPPTWFHSDLQPGNLLARHGDLVAVIDWEGCTVGDPSSDLLAAWWLFDGESREVLRSATGVGNAEWQRAKGWALLMAVAAIPYYSETNPTFASRARSALNEILLDD